MTIRRTILILAATLALFSTACSNDAPESLASTDDSGEVSTSTTPVSVVDTTSAAPSTSATATPTCTAPAEALHWVEVALDDPDGGLNMRTNAGVDFEIISTLPRSVEVATTGACVVVGSVDWWEVVPTGATGGGWVSSRYLSDAPVFDPGLGKAIEDTYNVELRADTLEDLAALLAEAYGFDGDVVITQVGEVEVADAVGGDVTYDLTGLKDDSVDGFRVDIGFHFDKNADATEITGFIAKQITTRALCSRGVTDDGLCI